MRILLIDNYDSFTFNLAQYLSEFEGLSVSVMRNDSFTLDDVEKFDRIVLSPGPGVPSEAGLMPVVVKEFAPRKPILGVCLGHQCIAEVFGGKLANMEHPVHGRATLTRVIDREDPLFCDIPDEFETGRYHSWVVSSLPSELTATAVGTDNTLMALRHERYPLRGVQFHPESILTPLGKTILANWIYRI